MTRWNGSLDLSAPPAIMGKSRPPNDHWAAAEIPRTSRHPSPVLSNIYLDRLDTYIEQALLPAYNQGDRRVPFRPYMRLWRRAGERNGAGIGPVVGSCAGR